MQPERQQPRPQPAGPHAIRCACAPVTRSASSPAAAPRRVQQGMRPTGGGEDDITPQGVNVCITVHNHFHCFHLSLLFHSLYTFIPLIHALPCEHTPIKHTHLRYTMARPPPSTILKPSSPPSSSDLRPHQINDHPLFFMNPLESNRSKRKRDVPKHSASW